jgi:hypothetical protein
LDSRIANIGVGAQWMHLKINGTCPIAVPCLYEPLHSYHAHIMWEGKAFPFDAKPCPVVQIQFALVSTDPSRLHGGL